MSQANASARKRRGVPSNSIPPPPPQPTITQQNQSQNSYTLQQIISIIDNRLMALEKGINNSSSNVVSNVTENNIQSEINNEFNERFNILVMEMNDLKETNSKLDDEIRLLRQSVTNLQTMLIQNSTSQKINNSAVDSKHDDEE